MILKFLDRVEETRRLKRAFASREGTFCCLYGRRRCGKSRLLQETLPAGRAISYVADESEAALQRAALAGSIAGMIPGFSFVSYPDWNSLMDRWLNEAPRGAVLAIDEFPYLAGASPEFESVAQKTVDRATAKGLHIVISGSSQRMMQGIVLDASAPLYGRAKEVINVKPLEAGWILDAMHFKSEGDALAAFAVWGGVPRYWELASDFDSTWAAAADLVLDPSGVLHNEPRRLLLDDAREIAQASSLLTVIGQGCNRLSEIAGRMGKPATSLSRPIQRLIDLGFVRRDYPFGFSERDTKRTVYRIADPFLRFWFRYVQSNRSRLEMREKATVQKEIAHDFPHHAGQVWEDLVRAAIPRMEIAGHRWTGAQRWWGNDSHGKPMECDVVARSTDGKALLAGEVKMRVAPRQAQTVLDDLKRKIERLPAAESVAKVIPVIFAAEAGSAAGGACCVRAEAVLTALR